jgi:hypothetical protein
VVVFCVLCLLNFAFSFADLENKDDVQGKIAIIERGDCTFVDKARKAQTAGECNLKANLKK